MWQDILHADQQLLLALNGSWGPFWDCFFYWFSYIPVWVPMYIVVAWFMWKRGGTRAFLWALLCLVVAVTLADQTCNFFKDKEHIINTFKFRPTHNPDIGHLVHYVKEYKGGLSGTASGHAALSLTFAIFTARYFRVRWYTVAIAAWSVITMYSRIYLGVHFPMDILFGVVVGLVFGFGSSALYEKIMTRPCRR